jgi:hypothetical protein
MSVLKADDSSVHLECASGMLVSILRQMTSADQYRTSVKSSHSPISLGTYHATYLKRLLLEYLRTRTTANSRQGRRQIRPQGVVLPRMALARHCE